ncbi:unnamed protein product, partial [Prorocentrum cordatum]
RLQHALRLRSRRLAGRCALPPASMSLGGVSVRPAVGPGHRDCDLACLFRWSVERDGTHCGTRAGRGEARLLGRPRARGGLRGAVATALRPARRACVGGGRGAQRRRAGP